MTLLEVKVFLQGISLGIGDRAPTYAEWKALLEHIDKNTVTVQPYVPKYPTMIPNLLVGSPQFNHPGVPASAAKNY
jgi:hypothetical protein